MTDSVDRSALTAAVYEFATHTLTEALLHWSMDGWRTVSDSATHDTTLGVHVVDLPTTHLRRDGRLDFTFYWPKENRWEGIDFFVCVE